MNLEMLFYMLVLYFYVYEIAVLYVGIILLCI